MGENDHLFPDSERDVQINQTRTMNKTFLEAYMERMETSWHKLWYF